MSSIFREAAVTYKRHRLDGDVMIGAPVSWQILGLGASAIVISALLFASCASYARKETVSGWIVPEGGLIQVSAKSGGQITGLSVHEGDIVSPGQALTQLKLSSDLGGNDTGVALQLGAKSELDAATLGTQASIAELSTNLEASKARRNAMLSERAELAAQVSSLEQQADLAKADLARAEDLATKGYMSRRDLDTKKGAAISGQLQVSEGRANLIAMDRQIKDLDSDIRTVPLKIAEARAQGGVTTANLTQKLTQIKAASAENLIAPVAGKVAALPVDVGQTLNPGGVAVVIIPTGSKLVAELYVPSRAAGFIQNGQEVSLRYQAFPYQKFGAAKGRVKSISKTVISPAQVAIPGIQLQEPVFRVRVELDREYVSAYGQKTQLQPGMLLDADIVFDRRSLFEWLMDPLYAVGKR